MSLSLDFAAHSEAIDAYRQAYATLRAVPAIACLYVEATAGGFTVTRDFSGASLVCISRSGMVTLSPFTPFVRVA